ncbi:MAG: SDR family NAD(P)-dependent oxidoreductase [Spirochaetales bacterium]|nr:SDR family NAD(P)-dependent oxidoreductase [Spirochaetales bacterium]
MGELALVTGATSGIGAAYSWLLAKKGWDLVITGRRRDIIEKRAEEIRTKFGVIVHVAILDFSNNEDFTAFKEQYLITKRYGFLVNCVGYSNHSNFFGTHFSINAKMIDVHINRMAEIIHMVVPGMKISGGTIVNVSSLAGFLPSLSDPFYSGTKSFINTYSESIAMILLRDNIVVQSLCPGFTKTDFHKNMNLDSRVFKNRGLKRWMTPKAVVNYSYKKLKPGKVIVIPGFFNKIIYFSLRFIPKKRYYKIAGRSRVLDEK